MADITMPQLGETVVDRAIITRLAKPADRGEGTKTGRGLHA